MIKIRPHNSGCSVNVSPENCFFLCGYSTVARYTFRFLLASAVIWFFCIQATAQTYYSQGSLPVNDLSSWNSNAGGGGISPADFDGTHEWVIQEIHDMTMSGDWNPGNGGSATITLEGSLTVSSTYLINITGSLTVNGTLRNSGTFYNASPITATAGITVYGIYDHNQDAGYLPVVIWFPGSTCEVTGWSSASPLNISFDQDFYNFTWDCPGQTGRVYFGGNVDNVTGTFTLVNSGVPENSLKSIITNGNPVYGNYLQVGGYYDLAWGQTSALVLTVMEDFTLTNGEFYQSHGAMTVINVGDDFSMSGGLYNVGFTNGSQLNVADDFSLSRGTLVISHAPNSYASLTVSGDFYLTGSGILNLTEFNRDGSLYVSGNFTHTSGRIIVSSTDGGIGVITFKGSGIQTYTSGGLLSGAINFIVGSGTDLPFIQMGTGLNPAVISGGTTGSFTMLPGTTLGVTSPDGISLSGLTGNIRVGGTRVFPSEANYIYNGTVSQLTGTGLTGAALLGINNPSGVTLSQPVTVSTLTIGDVAPGSIFNDGGHQLISTGTLNLTSGTFNLGSSTTGTAMPEFTTINYGSGTTVAYVSDQAQSISSMNYPNLYLSGGLKTIVPGAEITVEGDVATNGLLSVESNLTGSGSLIVYGEATGDVTYRRILREGDNVGDKHLISSPVNGQSVNDFVSDHSTKIEAVRLWDEVAAVWSPVSTPEFISGQGYNIQQTDGSDGVFSFTGPIAGYASVRATSPYAMSYEDRLAKYPDDPFGNTDHALPLMWATPRSWTNWGGGGWNLLGNPFTSAMNATDFIADNLTDFDPFYRALYVYDGANARYLYAGITIPDFQEGGSFGEYIQAGQGFMVLANNDGVNFEFDKSLQIHGSSLAYLKSANIEDLWPGLQLKVSYGGKEGITTVVYNNQMTPGLDPGYDIGQLSTGPEVEIYTVIKGMDYSVNLTRQALPAEGADKLIIPVGIDTEKGGEVTFSAITVPLGDNKFWLEDRTTGVFTDLTLKSYTVNLPPATYGTGRFFIIASANTPTGINLPDWDHDSGLRIWPYDGKVIIKGEVSEKAICEIYDLAGRKINSTRLDNRELNIVSIPSGTSGVLIIRVIDGAKAVTRKVVIP